jgi:DnaK suppressor protein
MAIEKVKPLTKKQIDQLRKKLQEEKDGLLFNGRLSAEELGLATTDDVNDEVDAAVADYEGSHLLRFRNRETFYAKKIDKALKKMELGEYGQCSDCAGPIKFERLLARPTAEMCIFCKEEAEREESSSFQGRQSKSLGKTVELSGNA